MHVRVHACMHVRTSVKGPPPPTWAASAEPEYHNSEVKLYDRGIKHMLVEEMEHFSSSKGRSVATTASIETETSAASAVRDACRSVVAGVWHPLICGF